MMSQLPRLSVLTACYNAAATLPTALKSILDQGYPNLEMIVLDAASTDGTLDVIKEHEKHISHWRSHKDNGPNGAYSEGIEKATGDIISLVNADDWLEPGTLQIVAKTFMDNPGTDVVTVVARVIEMDTKGNIRETKRFEGKAQELSALASPMPNARFFHRSVFERFGALKAINHRGQKFIAADLELLLRLSSKGLNHIALSHMGYTYRVHSDSLTFANNPNMNRQLYDERAWLAEQYIGAEKMGVKARQRFKRWHKRGTARLCYFYLREQQWQNAKAEMLRGIKMAPIMWLLEILRLLILAPFKTMDV